MKGQKHADDSENIASRRSGRWDRAGHLGSAGSSRDSQRRSVRLPILSYHSIGPQREGFDEYLTVPPEMFEQHLRWLSRRGYESIHLSDWVANQRDGKPLPAKPVVLTFDDGYRDAAEYGFPLLKRYGFKATLFVVSRFIAGTNTWDAQFGISKQALMDANEIRKWAEDGVEIGSHSESHPDLRICSDEAVVAELKNSREALEQIVGKSVTCFAYPYGYWDERIARIAESIYSGIVTSDCGINSGSAGCTQLRRAMVIPRYYLGQMFWATHVGFNPYLMLRIQFEIRSEWIGKRLFAGAPQSVDASTMALLNSFQGRRVRSLRGAGRM